MLQPVRCEHATFGRAYTRGSRRQHKMRYLQSRFHYHCRCCFRDLSVEKSETDCLILYRNPKEHRASQKWPRLLIQLHMYHGSPLFPIFRALTRSLHRHPSADQEHLSFNLTSVYPVPALLLLPRKHPPSLPIQLYSP